MTEEPQLVSSPRPVGRAAAFVAVVLVLWFVLASRNPQLTYHFAPLIAAVIGPVSLRTAGPVDRATGAAAALVAAAIVGLFAVALHVAEFLEGPTFWDEGPALTEALVFAVAGAGFGARVATRERPGLLGSIFEA